ncbi:MAG: MarR family transcriptional regulator [Calditrichia bacterium]
MRIEDEIKQEHFRNIYQKALINLIYTANWINSHSNRLLKQYGLSSQQFNVLRILRGQYPKPARVSLLQDRMMDKMSNASRLVEKLRQKGLVERKVCEQDRRAVDVVITVKGLDLLAEIDAVEGEFEKLLSKLDEKEAQTLNSLLDKIRT